MQLLRCIGDVLVLVRYLIGIQQRGGSEAAATQRQEEYMGWLIKSPVEGHTARVGIGSFDGQPATFCENFKDLINLAFADAGFLNNQLR